MCQDKPIKDKSQKVVEGVPSFQDEFLVTNLGNYLAAATVL
jgi:hypothetical protein